MTKRPVRIAVIGAGKMARAHSHAYLTAARFFDLPVDPVLLVLAGNTREHAEQVANAFAFQEVSLDWREVVTRDDIDLVDICTPNALHAQPALIAAERHKSVICEKPLATNVEEANRMAVAVGRAGVPNAIVFNYRYAPAVRHAHNLIAEGVLGDIRHFQLHFLQDWLVDPSRRMSWRLSADAGGGVEGDLGAHLIDLVHHLIGPIDRVAAADARFVDERPDESGALRPVDVEDVSQGLLATRSGAIGTLSVSRVAGGDRCENGFEIVGSRGSVRWEFQRLNELEVYLPDGPPAVSGWRKVSVTQPDVHPWAGTWWGTGHPIGYGETFVNLLAEFLGAGPDERHHPPTFDDGLQCQRVLDAIARAARSRQWQDV